MLKSYGWGGGPWDFIVSPSPFGLDFGTLDFWTSALGLTIVENLWVSLYLGAIEYLVYLEFCENIWRVLPDIERSNL